MTTEVVSTLTDNALPVDPKCLWKPSHPENTHMEKFRQLIQSKYSEIKLGMFVKLYSKGFKN